MQLFKPLLMLFFALPGATNARADEPKLSLQPLPTLPAPSLSRAQATQLATLTRAARRAEAEMTAAFDRENALRRASATASPAEKVNLERKQVVAGAASLSAMQNSFAADTARASFESRTRLPLEVRPYLPAGAQSWYLGLQRLDATGEPMLLHGWTAPRRATYGHYSFEPSPFCLDVFKRGGKDDQMPGKWGHVTATIFLGQHLPDTATMRTGYLHVASRQGPVILFTAPSESGKIFTIVTFPSGVSDLDGQRAPRFVQELVTSDRFQTTYDFGVDERGLMTLIQKTTFQSVSATEILAWNGREFAAQK